MGNRVRLKNVEVIDVCQVVATSIVYIFCFMAFLLLLRSKKCIHVIRTLKMIIVSLAMIYLVYLFSEFQKCLRIVRCVVAVSWGIIFIEPADLIGCYAFSIKGFRTPRDSALCTSTITTTLVSIVFGEEGVPFVRSRTGTAKTRVAVSGVMTMEVNRHRSFIRARRGGST